MLLKGNRFPDTYEGVSDAAIGYSKESVPKVLRTMEGPLEQVCDV